MTDERWQMLSPTGVAILRLIVIPRLEGCSRTEIAKSNGIAPSSVRPLEERLTNELLELAGEPIDA